MEETIFYVLFRSRTAFYDRMQRFEGKKTFAQYMEWQNKHRVRIEKINGAVIVSNFDIKYNTTE